MPAPGWHPGMAPGCRDPGDFGDDRIRTVKILVVRMGNPRHRNNFFWILLVATVACLPVDTETCTSGDPNCNALAAALLYTDRTQDPEVEYIYWMNVTTNVLARMRPDGSEIATVVSLANPPSILIIDDYARKLYWIENAITTVTRSDLDGTNGESFNVGGNPVGVAVDSRNGFFLVSDVTAGTITRYNLDGSGATAIYTGLSAPRGMAIDSDTGTLYWADATDGTFYAGSVAGGPLVTVLGGLSSPFGMVWDPIENTLLTLETAGAQRLVRYNQGSGLVEIVFSGLNWAGAFDAYRSRVFMADLGTGQIFVTDWVANPLYDLVNVGVTPTSLQLLYE